ncbi:MAG: Hpt domain-containing protein [Lachnospiraceae bacterium]|nr:Hpt domain-containing protein [Lachnospiraceae bacterium]
MNNDVRFDDLAIWGLNIEEGLAYTGNKEKYLAAIQRFYRRAPGALDTIEKSAAEGRYEDLTISVHALKSNAKMLGADRLSGLAEKMEGLGKGGRTEEMLKHLEELVFEYRQLTDILKPYGEMEEVHPASEISADEAQRAGAALLKALNDYDDEESYRQLHLLIRYPFRFTLINVLKEAERDIGEYDYPAATLKVRRVVSQIED